MSETYRDDTQEVVTIASQTWVGASEAITEALTITAIVLSGVLAVVDDAVAIEDSVIDKPYYLAQDTAQISDEYEDKKFGNDFIFESKRIKDFAIERLVGLTEETLTISDYVEESRESTISVTVNESITISAQALPQRIVSSLVVEQRKITDSLILNLQDLVIEYATLEDRAIENQLSQSLVTEQLTISDLVEEIGATSLTLVVESFSLTSSAVDSLTAQNLLISTLEIADEVIYIGQAGDTPSNSGAGQAWTANTENWAMSRYQPYTFKGLAVIDGALFGYADSGIYRLDGSDEENIEALLQTDKLDLSKGSLSHPTHAIMEYELDGDTSMEVSTTQNGELIGYEYDIKKEFADELTNGRFVFGRGLRGRHFSFALKLQGKSAHINDLIISSTETKRRI